MHFVLSRPLDEYKGSIGEALRHYDLSLTEGRKERSVSEVDKSSGMEPAVLNWFYQTRFWQQNKSKSGLFPQFEIGKYLKQLDPRYEHPMYRVDFLLVVREPDRSARKIIIEYDGFVEHFGDLPGVNEKNYPDYHSEEDVYRQKVLEGYPTHGRRSLTCTCAVGRLTDNRRHCRRNTSAASQPANRGARSALHSVGSLKVGSADARRLLERGNRPG